VVAVLRTRIRHKMRASASTTLPASRAAARARKNAERQAPAMAAALRMARAWSLGVRGRVWGQGRGALGCPAWTTRRGQAGLVVAVLRTRIRHKMRASASTTLPASRAAARARKNAERQAPAMASALRMARAWSLGVRGRVWGQGRGASGVLAWRVSPCHVIRYAEMVRD